MLIKIAKGWEIPESLATPEDVFLNRRLFLAGAGSIAAAGALPDIAFAAAKDGDPTADLYPAKRNPKYKIPLELTPEKINSTYNNFYEFGSHKKISEAAQKLPIRPWEVVIDGDVKKPFKLGIDELIRKMTLQEAKEILDADFVKLNTSIATEMRNVEAGALRKQVDVLTLEDQDLTRRLIELRIQQSDAAAAFNWNGIEGNKAYERPEDEVTGNDGDGRGERRPVGDDSMRGAVRYQCYHSKDGTVIFMASERAFWKNFCEGVGRPELFAQNPGAKYADHARGNDALRAELAAIFATRTTAEWIAFGQEVDTPIAPVNSVTTITGDPQFRARLPFRPWEAHGTDLMPSPIRPLDGALPVPTKAPARPGDDTDAVLTEVLDYDADAIGRLRATGALG